MPDEPNAKKLIRKALKRGPKDLDALRTLVVGQLVDAGKSEKKATKVFEAKLALPLFATAADGTVSLAGAAPAPAQASAAAKRKGDKAAPEPSAKKAKKAAAAGGKAAAGSSSGGAGAVRMMDAAAAAAYCEQNSVTLTGRGADAFRPLAGFADSGFGADALAAVAKFERPTPIQAVCWPVIAAGRDVVGVAETGSGKTLAFFLPAVSLLQAAAGKAGGGGAPSVRMLCLEPTRELAMQTEEVCAAAGKACGIASVRRGPPERRRTAQTPGRPLARPTPRQPLPSSLRRRPGACGRRCRRRSRRPSQVCIYGGVPKGPQTGALKRGAQVVIATPGRLLDLYQNDGAVDLSRLEYLVLDEARPRDGERWGEMGNTSSWRRGRDETRPREAERGREGPREAERGWPPPSQAPPSRPQAPPAAPPVRFAVTRARTAPPVNNCRRAGSPPPRRRF